MVILPCGRQTGSNCMEPCDETGCGLAPALPPLSTGGQRRNLNAATGDPGALVLVR